MSTLQVKKSANAINLRFDDQSMHLILDDGRELSVPIALLSYEVKIHDEEEKMDLFHYFSEYRSGSVLSGVKKYTIGLPFTILKALKGEEKPSEYVVGDNSADRQIMHFSKEELGGH
jgi:hypothetical protein